MSPVELILLYGVILFGALLLLTRHRSYIWWVSFLSFSLAMLLTTDYYQQQHQQKLAVHFLPHRTAISLTEGHTCTLLTDLNVTNDPRSFDFYLKNTFSQWGIKTLIIANTDSLRSDMAYLKTEDYALWVWRGKSLLIVNRLSGRSHWRLPAIVDYLIIRKNAVHDWSQLNDRVVARHIIFDDSNRTPLTDRLLAEAQQKKLTCYSVRQQGAFVETF